MIGPNFSHSIEYWCANTDLLFRLRFIYCVMVSLSFYIAWLSLWLLNKKVRNHWRGVDKLYGLYLLHHTNGQTHVCLIAAFVKIITNRVAVVYRFKSARMVSCWDLYTCSCQLGYELPIQMVLSSEYDDRLEDHFIMCWFNSQTTKYVTFILEQIDLHVFLPVIYQYSYFCVLTSAWQQA